MRWVALCLLLFPTGGLTPARSAEPARTDMSFRVDHITIEIDDKLRGNWTFSDFKPTGSWKEPGIEGIAVYRGGLPFINRWYGYDKRGVKIADGPLHYQDYPRGDKTRFEMILGDRWAQVQRIKIVAE